MSEEITAAAARLLERIDAWHDALRDLRDDRSDDRLILGRAVNARNAVFEVAEELRPLLSSNARSVP